MKTMIPPAGLLFALASGAALAQSQVTIYGVADTGAYAKQLSGQERVKRLDSGVMETSFVGFRGSEDLGDGLRAGFDISSFVRLDTGEPTRGIPGESFWSRGAWVSLSGGFGSLRLGRIGTPGFVNMFRFNPFGSSSTVSPMFLHTYLGSPSQPMATGSGETDSSWDNSVAYNSPTWGGASFALQAAPSEGPTAGRRVAASVSYSGQSFALMVSADRTSHAALTYPLSLTNLPGALPPFTGTDYQTVLASASYDFGVTKVFGQWGRTEIKGTRPGPPGETTIDLTTTQLGVNVPIGTSFVLLSVAHTNKTQTFVADQKRTTVTLGYDYFLSKRTDLYAVAMTDKVTELARGTGYSAGIRHRF